MPDTSLSNSHSERIKWKIKSEMLLDIADLVGVHKAMLLVYKLSSHKMVIPKNPKGTKLEKTIGSDAAEKISNKYATKRWEIPTEHRALVLWLRYRYNLSTTKIAHRVRWARNSVQMCFKNEDKYQVQSKFFRDIEVGRIVKKRKKKRAQEQQDILQAMSRYSENEQPF